MRGNTLAAPVNGSHSVAFPFESPVAITFTLLHAPTESTQMHSPSHEMSTAGRSSSSALTLPLFWWRKETLLLLVLISGAGSSALPPKPTTPKSLTLILAHTLPVSLRPMRNVGVEANTSSAESATPRATLCCA